MFFDGAAKGNSGKARGGGIIRCPLDQIISHFDWGLGLSSNNQAKAMALLQGLKQLQKHGIKEARVIGYLQNLIGLIVTK